MAIIYETIHNGDEVKYQCGRCGTILQEDKSDFDSHAYIEHREVVIYLDHHFWTGS